MNEMNYVWYSDATCETGRELAAALGYESGRHAPKEGTEFLICWGNRLPLLKLSTQRRINRLISEGRCLNNPMILQGAKNKYVASKTMFNNGVRTPMTCSPNEIVNKIFYGEMKFPVIGRKFHHQAGNCFHLCKDGREAIEAMNSVEYFVQMIPNQKEYRIHVFMGECIGISKKVEDYDYEGERQEYCRSHLKGWRFANKRMRDRYMPMVEEAKKAVSALGLDFGAADIVINEDGKPWVVEVNSGPGMIGRNMERYAEAIRIIENEIRGVC